jgi:hypothetical protein
MVTRSVDKTCAVGLWILLGISGACDDNAQPDPASSEHAHSHGEHDSETEHGEHELKQARLAARRALTLRVEPGAPRARRLGRIRCRGKPLQLVAAGRWPRRAAALALRPRALEARGLKPAAAEPLQRVAARRPAHRDRALQLASAVRALVLVLAARQ